MAQKENDKTFPLNKILSPLLVLTPRERAVFIEYHYFNTHMKHVAVSHKVSLGRVYAILYKAEDKLATQTARAQAAKAGPEDTERVAL